MQLDIRVMELLASKVCHDLVSPVSAINNGVELIQDIGGDVVDEAMSLIGNSGILAAKRLKLFRLAYGRAGSEQNLTLKDVRQILTQYMEGGKITLTWPDNALSDAFCDQRGALKTLANLLILAEETLAYGGAITLAANGDNCRLEITGRGAALSPAYQDALEDKVPVDEVNARTIQAYITGRFAEHFNLRVTHAQPATERLDLGLLITRV